MRYYVSFLSAVRYMRIYINELPYSHRVAISCRVCVKLTRAREAAVFAADALILQFIIKPSRRFYARLARIKLSAVTSARCRAIARLRLHPCRARTMSWRPRVAVVVLLTATPPFRAGEAAASDKIVIANLMRHG